jgi:hypothetical protein
MHGNRISGFVAVNLGYKLQAEGLIVFCFSVFFFSGLDWIEGQAVPSGKEGFRQKKRGNPYALLLIRQKTALNITIRKGKQAYGPRDQSKFWPK